MILTNKEQALEHFSVPGNFDAWKQQLGQVADFMLSSWGLKNWTPPEAVAPKSTEPEIPVAVPAAPVEAPEPVLPFFQSIALPLAGRGLKVMPINGKKAFLENHPTEATTDTRKISETWAQYGSCNVAVHCLQEEGGVLIVDADKGNPLESYTAETGKAAPVTYVVQSSPGKFHIYFWQTDATRALQKNITEGETNGEFSLRLKNFYCVGEGSIHPTTGGRYTALSNASIIPMPDDFLVWLVSRANKYSKTGDFTKKADGWINEPIIHGNINNQLTAIAGYYIQNKNIDDAAILYTILAKHAEAQAVHKDGVTPFACNQDEIRQIAVGAVSRWKTGEEKRKESTITFDQQPTATSIEPAEEPASRYAMSTEEMDAELEKEFPVIPLKEQVGPEWSDDIMYGLAGDIVRKASQFCEAHSAGMYLDLLVAIGNIIGRGPYFNISQTRHYTNEFMARVGDTADSRKGTGRDAIDEVLKVADNTWYSHRVLSGFGSAEAIVNELRDPTQQQIPDKKTMTGFREVTVPGITDKRLCIREGELASIFQLAGKNESRADIVLRDGWDGKTLRNLVKGKSKDGLSNSAICQAPHLSISGDTTRAELMAKMPQGAAENGFGNRFLYCYVYRTKLCPNGGPILDWCDEIARLHRAIEWAKDLQYVPLNQSASVTWKRMYMELDEPGNKLPGLAGKMTARAAAHIRRLALIFALLDEYDVVEVRHLRAAQKLWNYCFESARYIFTGATSEQSRIRRFLETNGASTVAQIRRGVFHDNKKTDWVRAQVEGLVRNMSQGVVFVDDKLALKK